MICSSFLDKNCSSLNVCYRFLLKKILGNFGETWRDISAYKSVNNFAVLRSRDSYRLKRLCGTLMCIVPYVDFCVINIILFLGHFVLHTFGKFCSVTCRKIAGPHICGDALDVEHNQILTGSWRKNNALQVTPSFCNKSHATF